MKPVFRSNKPRLPILIALLAALSLTLACGATTGTATQPPNGEPAETPAQQPTEEKPAPVENPLPCYPGIFVGQTSHDDVLSTLGQPLDDFMDEDVNIVMYTSEIPYFFNSLLLKNDQVALINVSRVDEANPLTLSRVKSLFGEPEQITFSEFEMGSHTYIYATRGVSFIVNSSLDLVFYQQCFLSMSLDEYMNSWGQELPLEDPFNY